MGAINTAVEIMKLKMIVGELESELNIQKHFTNIEKNRAEQAKEEFVKLERDFDSLFDRTDMEKREYEKIIAKLKCDYADLEIENIELRTILKRVL